MKKTNKSNRTEKPGSANRHNVAQKPNMATPPVAPKGESIFKKYINVYSVTTIAFVLFCYLMLPVRNSYMLMWLDEMSFFESTRFFFRQCLNFPGGLLRYAGSWLTQLMYYPLLGSSVLIIFWLLMAWITKKIFQIPRNAFPLAFIVPIALLVSIVQMDDAWISMKTIGYIYSNTLGYLFTVAAIWLYRLVERHQIVSMGLLLLTSLCYFFCGFYALFAAFIGVFLMIVDGIRGKRYVGLAYAAVVIIAILIIPNLYYQNYQPTSVDNDYLYLRGLPDLLMEKFDVYLWVPFIVATACLVVLMILSAFRKLPSARWMLWISVGVLVGCGVWSLRADKKNEQLRATVLMLNRLGNNDWEGMTAVMSRIKEPPNYTMRFLNNFAIANLGGSPEEMKEVKYRNKDARHAEQFSVTAYVNIPINYYNGKFNLSYRWGMEHSVQYGKRVFFMKYMIKSALLNGEYKLAKRYNDLLMRTMFHKKWAQDMDKYIKDPSLIETNPEFKSILEMANLNPLLK